MFSEVAENTCDIIILNFTCPHAITYTNLQPLGLVPFWGRYFHEVVVLGEQKPLNQVSGTSLFPK